MTYRAPVGDIAFALKHAAGFNAALAFTVISHQIIDVDDEELAYLQCLADLADIAVRQMLRLADEKEASGKSRQILRNLTTALAGSLNIGMSSAIFPVLGKLIPTRWFALSCSSRSWCWGPGPAGGCSTVSPASGSTATSPSRSSS